MHPRRERPREIFVDSLLQHLASRLTTDAQNDGLGVQPLGPTNFFLPGGLMQVNIAEWEEAMTGQFL